MEAVHCFSRPGSLKFEGPLLCSTCWRAEGFFVFSEPSIRKSFGKFWRNSSTIPAIDRTISHLHRRISRWCSAKSSSGSRALRSARQSICLTAAHYAERFRVSFPFSRRRTPPIVSVPFRSAAELYFPEFPPVAPLDDFKAWPKKVLLGC